MENLISISEAAAIMRVPEHLLRHWDEKGTFPAFRTEKGHRRYRRDHAERFAQRDPNVYWNYEVRIEPVSLDVLRKDGPVGVLPERWKWKTHLSAFLVAEKNWSFGEKTRYFYISPDLPKIAGHTDLDLMRPGVPPDWWVQFPQEQRERDQPKFANLLNAGWCGPVDHGGDAMGHRYYFVPQKYLRCAYLWSFGYQAAWLMGEQFIPEFLYLVVADQAFDAYNTEVE
jgi:hypothetical protein